MRKILFAALLFAVPAAAQTPGSFPAHQALSSADLNAAFGSKANANNPVITGTLSTTGTASFGNGSTAWLTATGGASATLGVAGSANAVLNLRSNGTGSLNIGGSAFSAMQIFPAATNGGILSITQPAAVGTAISFDATGGNTAGFLFRPRTVFGVSAVLSNSSVTPFWVNVGNNVSGTQTTNVHQVMMNIGSNADTLSTDGGVNMLTVTDSVTTGWSGSRSPLKTAVTDIASTPFSTNGHFLIGFSSRSELKFNQGGTATGYGTTQFGEGVGWGATIQSVAFGTNTYFAGINGVEIDVTATAGTQILSEYGLQIVHEGPHAVQGNNFSAALMISDQVSSTAAWKNLVIFGNYQSKWPLDPNGYLVQVRSNGNPLPVGAGGFDLRQMTVTGVGPEGGGFFWASPGVDLLDTAVHVGYGALTNNATGLLIDATYKKMSTAAGAITVATPGGNFTTGDIACDTVGNCVVVTASAGAVTAVSSVITRGWQTSPPADPVTMTARTRVGTAYGSGLTLNYGVWAAQTGVTVAGSGSKLAFYGATPIVMPTGVAVTAAGLHAALTSLGLIAP